MIAASRPRARAEPARLLHVDPRRETIESHAASDLAALLAPGDLLVANDAATLPASLRLPALDAELRLVARGAADGVFGALLFGGGDHRTPTERRPEPPRVRAGATLEFDAELSAMVLRVDPETPRLIEIRFSLAGAALLAALYRLGRPIQYAHVPEPLALWDVQNRFAARPWAFEPPSAGQPIDGELLLALRRRDVAIATLTHAAGISSTGSEALDRRLPLPEQFEIPEATLSAIAAAERRGGRVVAVGTTVVRALESSACEHGAPRPGRSEARLVIGPGFRPRVASGILSGMHEPGTSHFALLSAFAPAALLTRAFTTANALGYRQHEFGDSCLVLGSARAG